ncbi:MAG: DEAD/DEAH box helicase family protein, partial [Candidatus Latescibacteria bacterium]|nr:DEAD/DEAH box helicase family protein [Candidatus Latescibacterota bacterium]
MSSSTHPPLQIPFPNYTALALSAVDNAWHLSAALVEGGLVVEQDVASDLISLEDKLLKWTSDGPVVVHRIGQFEECTLGVSLVSTVLATTNPELHDSHQLARIVLPRLRDHNLTTLARYLEVNVSGDEDNHAVLSGLCYAALQQALLELDVNTVNNLVQLSQGLEPPLSGIFAAAQRSALKRATQTRPRNPSTEDLIMPSFNVGGTPSSDGDLWTEASNDFEENGGSAELLNTDEIVGMFEEGGAIDSAMDRFEHRPQQMSMVRAVTDAINGAEFLMVEAGTGTGKSLSYLVPAIYWALKNDQRVIISTNTKNLQEQLFFKDVPFLTKTLQADFRVTLLKGRSNYLCADRWNQVMAQFDEVLSRREQEEALPLVVWKSETQTGDISENLGFNVQAGRSLWAKINGEGGACPRCMFQEDCFVNRARAESASSHLVIINHALLFSDIAADNVVLSDYSHLIVDEAHNLERVAVQHMTIEVGPWRTRNMIRKLYLRDGNESGCLATLKFRAEKTPMKQIWKDHLAAATTRAIDAVSALDQSNDDFFLDVNGSVVRSASRMSSSYAKLRYTADSEFAESLRSQAPDFIRCFARIRETLAQVGEVVSEISESWMADREEFLSTISSCLETSREIEEDLSSLIHAGSDNTVYWAEASQRSESSCLLVAAPLNVSEQLHETLFSRLRSVIFTSATLAVGDRFGYAARRIGLDRLEKGRLKTFRIGSPFNFEEQALVCVPNEFPKPRDDGFQEAVSELIQGLVFAARRSTLVLFTSYGMLNQTYKDLEQPFGRLGIPLMAQGISGPRTLILDRFRNTRGSVLLGTDSFWEGIDVPGEALEL